MAARNRSALQRLQGGLAGVEEAVGERGRAGYQQVQAAFSLAQRLQRLLFPAAADPAYRHSPGTGAAGGGSAPPEAAALLGEVFRALSALGTLLTTEAGERPLPASPGSPQALGAPAAAAAAAAAAAVSGGEVQQLCEKVGLLSHRLHGATADKLALQNLVSGGPPAGPARRLVCAARCPGAGWLAGPAGGAGHRLQRIEALKPPPPSSPLLQSWSSSCRA
jgi:hypothetical protein